MSVYFPPKAYKDLSFLNSSAARNIRILCEFDEPRERLAREGVKDTVVFFGSARIRSAEELADLERTATDAGDTARLDQIHRLQRLTPYYDAARELSRRLTEWNLTRPNRDYLVATGGGPGIMAAANQGASEVEGGRSLGLGISLPFEQGINSFVPPELGFEFHYFFTRKFWFVYMAKALVIFPGGFGTLDEMFETLTLVQTHKIEKHIPVVLFGRDYWDRVINMDVMAEYGTIAPQDPQMVFRTDSVDEAFDYLVRELLSAEAAGHGPA
ncbi:MAG: LOG family protein [Deltaproteobacteria bacterium]|nr:LOG family protein [Deltaproteobacteria bacterium]